MKMALSERTSFEVHLPMLEMDAAGKPLDLRTTVTRAEMEAACGELVDRTIQAVQDVLLDAKLKASAGRRRHPGGWHEPHAAGAREAEGALQEAARRRR